MTQDEWCAFLTEGTRTGILCTVRADGRPHAAPVWFVLDGDDVMFTTGANSVKGRNLHRDGRAVLAVDEATPPYDFVTFEGGAELSTDPGEMLRWASAIGARYMGAARGAAYGARNAVPGELLVRLVPTKIIALAGIAD